MSFCCLTNFPQIQWLKTIMIYLVSAFEDWKFGLGSAGLLWWSGPGLAALGWSPFRHLWSVPGQRGLTDFWLGCFGFPLYSLLFSKTCSHGDGGRNLKGVSESVQRFLRPRPRTSTEWHLHPSVGQNKSLCQPDLRGEKLNFISWCKLQEEFVAVFAMYHIDI